MADKLQPPPKPVPEAPKPLEKSPALQKITGDIDEILRQLKLLEERYSGLRKKSQFTEQNMLKETKDVFEEVNSINSTITEIKSDVSEIKEKLEKLTDEVNTSVKKADFNVLVKYLDFWEPLNFITKDEAMRLFEESRKQ
jgi:uncharacterized coiled-coil DUF342 family protein